MHQPNRRVVITGYGLISPLGNNAESLWQNLSERKSGVGFIKALPEANLPTRIGGEATEFTGSIGDFGELEKTLKRSVKKGLRLMCREIEMGVASSQLALQSAGITAESYAPERIGTLFGSDYILTMPQEFTAGVTKCLDENEEFQMSNWGENGIPEVAPLWLLKYLPNMPASHVAIYNDLRGPSNSLTMREASSNVAVAEAVTTIRRGVADAMLAGATGTRIHPLRSIHVAMQEKLVDDVQDPTKACRPFDKDRTGMVIGEGAGCFMLEALETAQARSASIHGEIAGYSTSTVADKNGVPDFETAFSNVLKGVLETSGMSPEDVGHIHAHGVALENCDQAEAAAIKSVFGENSQPVVAAKSYMGNLGAGSGLVEAIASLKAMEHGELFPILNYDTPDPACPINAADPSKHKPGDSFVSMNVTPQGQASAILVKAFAG